MSGRLVYVADIRFPIERANGIQTAETCAAIARRGWDVRLVVRPDTAVPPRDPWAYYGLPTDARLSVDRIRVAGPPAVRRAMFLMGAWTAVCAAPREAVVMTRDLGVAAMVLRNRPIVRASLVYESHGFAPLVSAARPAMLTGSAGSSRLKERRLARRERLVWRLADGYATITRGLADEMVARFGPRPALAVIPDGARPHSSAVSGLRPMGTPPVVAYCGHLYPWKGVDVLIEALARVPEVRGLVIGGHPAEPDLARVRELAARIGVADRVTFSGLVDPPEVAERLAAADVLVLPNTPGAVSARYTSPLKLFEYLAAGRPMVASDLPAFREVLRDGENAILFEAGSAEALAAAIRTVVADPDRARTIAARAEASAADYTWDRRAERLEALLVEARQRRAGGGRRTGVEAR